MTRISYKEWAALGGLRNPDLCRKMKGNLGPIGRG